MPRWRHRVRSHSYDGTTVWTGNTGSGPSGCRDYSRSLEVSVPGREVPARLDGPRVPRRPRTLKPRAAPVGGAGRHVLSYLYVCVDAGVVVTT